MDGRVKSDGYKRKEENWNDDRRVNTLQRILFLLIILYQKIKFHNENIRQWDYIHNDDPRSDSWRGGSTLYKLTRSFERKKTLTERWNIFE